MARIVDIHTHILPGMDDGSRSAAQSLAMLGRMAQQNIFTLAATPHFYATRSTPERFFEARNKAWERLRAENESEKFDIRLGAEVQYYEGICRLKEPERFCIGGTDLFLLEMPFMPWEERMLDEVQSLTETPGLRVIIAHIERYLPMQPKSAAARLLGLDVLVQINAEAFSHRHSRRAVLRLMKAGRVDLIGSDCHNDTGRPPDLSPALEQIRKRLGSDEAEGFLARQEKLFFGGEEAL